MSNVCPVRHCENHKAEDQVACAHHWYKLPRGLRERIWRLFRQERGSDAHLQAIDEAIQRLNPKGEVSDNDN